MKDHIPYIKWSEGGELIHFAHANGFPPACYQPLLAGLANDYEVWSMLQRPLWKNEEPTSFKSWQTLADDLIEFLDAHQLKNIIGIGHSMGGIATAVAAAKRPDLFKKVVLLDPVLGEPKMYLFSRLMPMQWRKHLIPIAKIALKRRDQWPDKSTVYASWRKKRIFAKIPDVHFSSFLDGAVYEKADGQIGLTYSKEWETRIYCTVTNGWPYLAQLQQPTLAVKAAGSNLLYPKIWEKWKRIQPRADFKIVANTSHLLPLERPTELINLIRTFI